jgi:hypothetical protein
MNFSTLSLALNEKRLGKKLPLSKLMKPIIGLIMLLLLNTTISLAQVTGDFRSSATGVDLNSITNWQTWTGSWVPATLTPNGNVVSGNTITILATHSWGNTAAVTIPFGVTILHQGATGTFSAAAANKINMNGTYIHNTTGGISNVLGGMNNNSGSNVIIRGTSALNAATSISGRTFHNLTFESTSGLWTPGAVSGTGAFVVNGNFDIGGSGAGTVNVVHSGASSSMTVVGNFSVKASCTYVPPTGTLTFSGNITKNGTLTFNATAAVIFDGTTTLSGSTLHSFANGFTVNAGKSFANSQNGNIVATGKTAAINGTFQVNEGSWTGTTGTYSYGANSTLTFNNSTGPYGPIDNSHLYWPSVNPPVNVTVLGAGGININVARTVSGIFQTASGITNANNLTLNGTGKLNTGGFFAAIPVWGASSTLIYNTGTTFGRGNEFPNAGNLPSNVQVSGNTTINYPNAGLATRTLTGNLTIDAGSAFYMDFGSPNPGVGILTVNNLVLNGNLSLGSQPGGDLVVKGNFTRTGTFAPVGRAVFFNAASGNQTITGATTFDYLIVDKAAGSVVLANDITVSQVLTLSNGTVNTSSNKVIISSSNAAAAVVRTNGYVNGNLQRAIATGANTYIFAVGTSLGYTPASLAFTAVGGAGNITMASADAAGANYPASLNSTIRLARNWSSINSGVTGITGSATFTYLLADLVGGAVSANLKAYVYNGSTFYPTSNTNTANSFTYNGLTTVGEFGAGECGTSLAPTFTKTMVSSCGGGADGAITVTPVGGVAPYTYNWTSTPGGFSGNTAAVTGLTPRDYTVVVTDAIGCTKSIPDITIFQAFAAVVTNNGGGSSSCGNTGYILLYGSGGVQPYTYSIDGTSYSPSNSFTGLAAGTYTGYVKDFGGCVSTKPNIVVTGAAAMTVTANTRPATSCASNGTIELYRTGGVAPYTYSLDDVTYQGSNTFNNLAGNATYTGWVKDASGCKTSLANITVGKAPAITVSSTVNNTSACSNTGRIQVLAGGGVPGYTYSITGANGTYQAGNAFTGLAAGTYDVWVQDSKGCKNVQFNVTVGTNAASTITVTAYARSASSCANNGSIELYRTGGVSPFTYSLDNVTYQASNTFTGLAGGTYTGWVKDANGCTGSLAGITITQAAAVTAAEQHTNASCINDGTIQLTPGGGVPGYTYSLDNITYQPGNSFSGLAAGNYTGWVKDSKGCTASVPVTIGTAASIVVTAYTAAATNCETANGSIQLFRTGGTGPFTYSLDNVTYQASNTFTGKTAGTYTGYVKDSKGCVGSLANIFVGPNCAPPIVNSKTQTLSKNISVNELFSVQAYPNPSTTEFTLVLKTNNREKVVISVTDILGRNVYQSTSGNKIQYRFGSNLKPGMYNVLIMQGEKKQSIKLVKE